MFKPRRVITGCTEQLALADIVQTLSLGTKTACITLTLRRREGRIWFEEGVVKHAQTDRSKGEAAFCEMVTWRSADFVIEHGVKSKETTLDTDGMLLVMEGLRRLDESAEPPDEPGEQISASAATGPDQDASPDRKKTLRSEVWTRTAAFLALSLGATALILVARNLAAGATPPEPRAPTPVVRLPAGSAPARTLEIPARLDVGGEAIPDEPANEAKATAVVPQSAPAEPEPRAATGEIPVEAPEVTLADLAEVLDVMPLGIIGPLAELLPERRAAPASYVELDARSLVEAGTLTLFVDGEEIYVRDLSSAPSPTRGVFKKSRIAEEFDAQLELAAGEHELVARVELDGDSNGHEQSIVLDLVPGATQTLELVAGRKRRPISLKATKRRDPETQQAEPAIDTSSLDD